jgi:hypothetical protein
VIDPSHRIELAYGFQIRAQKEIGRPPSEMGGRPEVTLAKTNSGDMHRVSAWAGRVLRASMQKIAHQ